MTSNRVLSFSSRFVAAFLDETGAVAAERRSALEAAAIPLHALQTPDARITEEQFSSLFRHLANTLEDELPGLLSKPLRCGAMKYAALSVITAPTLAVALRRHARYLNLVIHDFEVSCETGLTTSTIAFTESTSEGQSKEMAFALTLKLFHGLASWLVGRELPLARASFTFPAPAWADDLHALYPGPIRFDCERSELVFASSLLDLKVQRTPQDLRGFLDRQPRDWLSALTEQPLADRVRQLLSQAGPVTCTAEDTALHLGLSARSLSRRLKDEGTSFQQVKDGLRFGMAVARLTQTDDPLSAIADDLGFSDASSFHRAFRAWSGVAPGSFRRRPRAHESSTTVAPGRRPQHSEVDRVLENRH